MRRDLSTQRWDELHKFIDECEWQLPVTEQEKILVRLAFLMGLMIEAEPSLRERIGKAAKTVVYFSELSQGQLEAFAGFAQELQIPTARLVFWMWRSWTKRRLLLSVGAEGSIAYKGAPLDLSGELRNSSEDEALSDELKEELRQAKEDVKDFADLLEKVAEDIRSDAADNCQVMALLQGSSMARLEALRRLYLQQSVKVERMRDELLALYGFTRHQKANKRLDRNSARDATIYFHWHRPTFGETAKEIFNSREAARKAAHRFSSSLLEYDKKLKELEDGELIPRHFYARSIPGSQENENSS